MRRAPRPRRLLQPCVHAEWSGAPPSLPRWTQRLRKNAGAPFYSILFTHDARSWGSLQARGNVADAAQQRHAPFPQVWRPTDRRRRRSWGSLHAKSVGAASVRRMLCLRQIRGAEAAPTLQQQSSGAPYFSILFTHDPAAGGDRGGLAKEMLNIQYPTLNIQGRNICAELHHWSFLVGYWIFAFTASL